MKEITKEAVFAEHNEKYRKTYYDDGIGGKQAVGLQIKGKGSTFSAYMKSSIKIFEAQTDLELDLESKYQGRWRNVNEEEITKIKDWMKAQGALVFLRDCLCLSVALSINFDKSGDRTTVGQLRNEGKWEKDASKREDSIHQLADLVEQQILNLPYYKEADLICSVPSPTDKDLDLSSRVAFIVSEKIGKQNITEGFIFGGQKLSIRDASFDEKWKIWEDAKVSFRGGDAFDVNGKTVILIDDLYQSGITMQYIAMKLQQAGARKVYGLSFIKTRGDADNASLNTNDE